MTWRALSARPYSAILSLFSKFAARSIPKWRRDRDEFVRLTDEESAFTMAMRGGAGDAAWMAGAYSRPLFSST